MTGRRITTTLTLTGLVVVLCVMAVWGYRAATRPFPSRGSSSPEKCHKNEISKQFYVTRDDVTVSVYNAGARKGFAGLTLDRLERKGFNPGAVGNAPEGTSVRKAKVFTTQTGDTAAKLVARTMGKQVPIKVTDDPMGPGIDVYVGPKMRLLNQHAPRRVKLPKPVETCVKVD